ncbi:hypothetical protein FQA39_LY09403 [Lamprigera yunnana]|nr:hypothetical protein FQA39_LY09403 [Lamprigera yunnana]
MSTTNSKISYNVDWIIPSLRNPSRLWSIAASITIACVGIFSKILIQWFNKSKIHNRHYMVYALDKRPNSVPLITVSNHHSCFDDPGIWATLDVKHLLSKTVMRWSLAANDICFSCLSHARFFKLGKCVPVIRGNGVYQDAVDFCLERLANGDWVHIFPEGKVNLTKDDMRLKWGVGRMIFESPVTPIVIPIWHIGMDDVLPNNPPYMVRIGKNLTFNFGKPLDFTPLVQAMREQNVTDIEARKEITDCIQAALRKLKVETEELHRQYFSSRS